MHAEGSDCHRCKLRPVTWSLQIRPCWQIIHTLIALCPICTAKLNTFCYCVNTSEDKNRAHYPQYLSICAPGTVDWNPTLLNFQLTNRTCQHKRTLQNIFKNHLRNRVEKKINITNTRDILIWKHHRRCDDAVYLQPWKGSRIQAVWIS